MFNFFREQREKLGISQRKLAIILGVSNQSISGWESGDYYPTATPISALAQAYGVNEDRMAKEVMAQRRVIEERHEKSHVGK